MNEPNPDVTSLLQQLQESTSQLEAAAKSLPADKISLRPSPECWSALEILEHVYIVDRVVAERAPKAEMLTEPQANAAKEDQIRARVTDRTTRIQAPSAVNPAGKFKSLDEALGELRAGRAQLADTIVQHAGKLRRSKITHPILGEITAYELYVSAAAHGIRHARQLEEWKARLA
jgi:hypothetical protein